MHDRPARGTLGRYSCVCQRDLRGELEIGNRVNPDKIAGDPSESEAVALDDELAALLTKLGRRDAEIVRLRWAGYSTAEIAACIGSSRVTVWRKLDRASCILAGRGAIENGETQYRGGHSRARPKGSRNTLIRITYDTIGELAGGITGDTARQYSQHGEFAHATSILSSYG